MVDNFGLVEEKILRFSGEGEFYMVLILKRRKDTKGTMVEGVNEDNRLIKHFFVYDKEYLWRKKDAIKSLCEQNNARAYILPQRRSCRQVLWALHDKVSDTLRNGTMNTHFDHLIRSCVAGCHETAARSHKRWVIDIDGEDPKTLEVVKAHWEAKHPGDKQPVMFEAGVFVDFLKWMLREALVPTIGGERSPGAESFMPSLNCVYAESDITVLPTPHGFHIVTPPFNRDKKALVKYLGGDFLPQDWIKPDAMAMLFAPDSILPSNPFS